MTTLHAHVDHYSADCDGSYSRDYVVWFNDDETTESQKTENDFSEITFMGRVMGMLANPYATTSMTVKVHLNGFEANEDTEEGYSCHEVRWCRDECPDTRSQRDHRAESMGY